MLRSATLPLDLRLFDNPAVLEDCPASMVLYAGANRDEEIPVAVTRLGCGAGEIDCIECDGTGIWTYLPPDAEPVTCTTCKGTGTTLVSI